MVRVVYRSSTHIPSSAVHLVRMPLVVCATIVNTTGYSTVISFQQSFCRMSKIYKGWLDSAKSLSHCKAQKSVYTRSTKALADVYILLANSREPFAFFIRVMWVLKQFYCQLETFPTKHSYFCGSVMCYTMKPAVKTLFLTEQSRACLGADISTIVVYWPKLLRRYIRYRP